MVMHLGISGWEVGVLLLLFLFLSVNIAKSGFSNACHQTAFGSTGLDPVAKQWLRLYCPERLATDLACREEEVC